MYFSYCVARFCGVCARAPSRTLFFKNFSSREVFSKRTANPRNVHSGRLPFDALGSISKDIVLYSYEKDKFFKYMGLFGVIQLFLWTYWGLSLYEGLRDINVVPEEKTEQYLSKHPIWRRINLGEKKYRITALVSCLTIGIGTLLITFALPSRIVRHLTLHKGGMGATLTTYGPFGRARDINVHIRQLSCQNTRDEAKAYISLKVKGKWMYFLLDCRGKFYNPQLFDYTVGASSAKIL